MKKTITAVIAALITLSSFAQTSGGPDAYGYTWKNSSHGVSPPVYNWIDISTTGTLVTGLGDDNFVGPFTGSGGFQYYWYPTPQFWIGSNGFISFVGANIASPFPASIPLSSGVNNWIAPFMADLNFTGTGNPAKCYQYSNADSLVVTFDNVPFWYSASPAYTGSCTFQVILSKLDTSITFNYQSMSLGLWTTTDAAIGMENNTGTLGLGILFDQLPPNNSTIKVYYPAVVTYSVTDGGMNWTGNEESGGKFVKSGGAPDSLKSNVRNFGNQLLSNFTVYDSVRNSIGTTISDGSLSIGSLTALSDTTLTFPNTFAAPATGIYTYSNSVTGVSGDLVASNDSKTQKIIAIDTSQGFPSSPGFVTLDYSDGAPDGGGLGWTGGDGGLGIYIEPPFYPARVVSSRFYVNANTSAVGFHAKIYDDDGPNGAPGTLLDSVYVPPASITLNVYTVVPTSQIVDIAEGGVYLQWYMGGANINLARDLTPPISRRTFEILGNSWSGYRDKQTEDFLFGIDIKYAPPIADFSIDSANKPEMVFTDLSIGADTWDWDFGDGVGTSTMQHPTYAYQDTGYFDVCLKVTGIGGKDSTCKNVHIDKVLPEADFTYDSSASPTFNFTDVSTGVLINSWYWDFDDTGDDTSALQHPTFLFTSNGIHNVCLTVVNHAGASVKCKDVNVTGVGIAEVSNGAVVRVYPNPFSDKTRIEVVTANGVSPTSMKIFDALGKQVSAGYTVHDNFIELDRGGMHPGTYFFEIYNADTRIANGRMMVK